MTCPTPTGPVRLDLRNQTCVMALQSLLNAYYTCLVGNQRVQVRFQERWTEYQKVDADKLREAYNTLYRQCPGAQAAGLPDLNPGLSARRGPPTRGFNVFPRM